MGAAAAAIAGLGVTEMGKVYGRTPADFAAEAIALALDDAGLTPGELDGLLVNSNHSAEMGPWLQFSLGLSDLALLAGVDSFGASAGARSSPPWSCSAPVLRRRRGSRRVRSRAAGRLQAPAPGGVRL
jgi:hypothetical protein